MPSLVKELDIVVTGCFLRVCDLLGGGALGCTVRGRLMRLFGFPVGVGAKISSHLQWHRRSDKISIGKGTFINKCVLLDATSPIEIGKYCDVGYNTTFATTNHVLKSDYKGRRPVASKTDGIVVEDFVWIGCDVTILPGVRIGRGSVVAAGSLVTSDIPPETLAMGRPAKVIRSL